MDTRRQSSTVRHWHARLMWCVIGMWGIAAMPGCADSVSTEAEPVAEPVAEHTESTMIADGSNVQMDYTLTVDGEVVDASPPGQPLTFVQGSGQIIPGLESALLGMRTGESKVVTVQPEGGYGAVNPEAFLEITRSQLPPDLQPEVGMMLAGQGQDGRPFQAVVHEVHDDRVVLNLNHPLAGKALQFDVTIVGVKSAT